MFMPRRGERLGADAYTRASVEEYLRAVSEERARIELAIAEARQRRDAVQETVEYLDALERDAGARSLRPWHPRWPSMSEPAVERAVMATEDTDVVPGDVVRDLVPRSEREIEALEAELQAVLSDVETTEQRVREHPALALLDPVAAARLVPAVRTRGEGPPPSPNRPRTVVDTRRRMPADGGAHRVHAVAGAPGNRGVDAAGSERRDRLSGLTRSPWVWWAGLAITVGALLLLRIG